MKKFLVIVFLVAATLIFGQVFFGNIHAHTSYSDGQGTPEEAFEHARNSGAVDIQAITDHDHDLNYKLPDGSWKLDRIIEMAKKYTVEGEFIAISGFEWTLTSRGHITIYNTSEWIDRSTTDLYDIYQWIVDREATAQFCHPGRKYGDFFDFEYFPKVDLYINTIEVGNGAGSNSNNVIKEEYFERYQRALNRGWHVGASANQDNHQKQWATVNDARTAFVIDELTTDKVYEALKTRNIYATEDRNAYIAFVTEGAKMGDILYDIHKATLRVEYSDPGEPVRRAAVYSNNGVIELDVSGDEWIIELNVDNPLSYNWYFVKIDQIDGNEIVSSPIWFQSSTNKYLLNARTISPKPVKGLPFEIGFDLINSLREDQLISVEVKSGEKTILDKDYEVSSMTCAEITETLETEEAALDFFVDGELAFRINVDFVSFLAHLDTSHENYFVPELKPLTQFFLELGGEVRPVIGELTEKTTFSGQVLILPLPDSDTFMKDFMEISEKQIDFIVDYVENGGLLVIVLAKKEITHSSIESYKLLFEKLPWMVELENGGMSVSGTSTGNLEIENGGGVVILTWDEATGKASIDEGTKGYIEFKLGLR
ncbi:CehA/McbA family metallohydrolase [Mesotoga sp.]|uniref:CehA/McbA family metallohydrolase n=1 Tax=Mesotoga sp. TaxID=2053577 RepID=UPI001BD53ED6|nr:CehA/McbA family metallohydrolase [Mesotoga sp.]